MATASLHGELDAGLPIARPHAGIADYLAHLRVMRHWMAPLERALSGEWPSGLRMLDQTSWIDADLAFAGMPGDTNEADTGECVAAPQAARWGFLYVLEGSRLGAGVLLRRLEAHLAPHPLHYLRGDGETQPARWHEYVRLLNTHVRGERDVALAVDAAVQAFQTLVRCFRDTRALTPEATT